MTKLKKGDIVHWECDGSSYVVLEVNPAGECRLSTIVECAKVSSTKGGTLDPNYFFGFVRTGKVIGNVEDQDGV
jgi:hypothetical protein